MTLDYVFSFVTTGFVVSWCSILGSLNRASMFYWDPYPILFKIVELVHVGSGTFIPPIQPFCLFLSILFDNFYISNDIYISMLVKFVSVFSFWTEWSSLIIIFLPLLVSSCFCLFLSYLLFP